MLAFLLYNNASMYDNTWRQFYKNNHSRFWDSRLYLLDNSEIFPKICKFRSPFEKQEEYLDK